MKLEYKLTAANWRKRSYLINKTVQCHSVRSHLQDLTIKTQQHSKRLRVKYSAWPHACMGWEMSSEY